MMAIRVSQSLAEREVLAAMESGSTVPSTTATSDDLQSCISSSTPPPADDKTERFLSLRAIERVIAPIAAIVVESLSPVVAFSDVPQSCVARLTHAMTQRQRHRFDKTVIHLLYIWIACLVVGLIYAIWEDAVASLGGRSDAFRPFIHRFPEFIFWRRVFRSDGVEGQFPGGFSTTSSISVAAIAGFYDAQSLRHQFGEGIEFKVRKVLWRLGRRIWDPGKSDLRRRHELKKEIMYWYNLYWYNLSVIKRQSKSWTRTSIKIHVISCSERYWVRLRCNRWIAIIHLQRNKWLVITMMIATQDDPMGPRTSMDIAHNRYGYLFTWKSYLIKKVMCNCTYSILKFCLSIVSVVVVVLVSLVHNIVNFGSFY